MKIHTQDFIVKEGKKVKLKEWPTLVNPFYHSKNQCKEILRDHEEQLNIHQKLHYATSSYPLLFILQGMDTAGKDSVIRHVMSGINPQGCQVSSFKQPLGVELAHDFLWRYVEKLPECGKIGIFNRSYYEEVLVLRVHPEIIQNRNIPSELLKIKTLWEDRYQSINNLEKHLTRNGTKIIKFFLHLSKDEQKKRLLDRIDDPSKNWKITKSDLNDRNYWNDYIKVYEKCLSATSSDHAPWFIIPADDKPNARLIVSQVILETMDALKMKYPALSKERQEELKLFKEMLVK
jgi:PPK2 family polyphosphate:nucleotide phosphotransferase